MCAYIHLVGIYNSDVLLNDRDTFWEMHPWIISSWYRHHEVYFHKSRWYRTLKVACWYNQTWDVWACCKHNIKQYLNKWDTNLMTKRKLNISTTNIVIYYQNWVLSTAHYCMCYGFFEVLGLRYLHFELCPQPLFNYFSFYQTRSC